MQLGTAGFLVGLSAMACACPPPGAASAPATPGTPPIAAPPPAPSTAAVGKPTADGGPLLHGARLAGPFKNEAELCASVYRQPSCFSRKAAFVQAAKRAPAQSFLQNVEVVSTGGGEYACAVVLEANGSLYVHSRPSFCLQQGHTVLVPSVKSIEFRDLDGRNHDDLAIVVDVRSGYDPPEGVEATNENDRRFSVALFCGRNAGSAPSCVEVTTDDAPAFVAAHGFSFE